MLNPMNLLGGGSGPSVNANTQAGKTNSQTLGNSTNTDQEISLQTLEGNLNQSNDKNKVSTDSVENININEIPPWVLILLVLGWLAPSPQEMGRGLLTLIATLRRKKDGSAA
tara:strand:+ start:687 stop:1022 length:336 start_codon:yes stop_codon:yes gene_type:complete